MIWMSSEVASSRRDKEEVGLGNQSEDEIVNDCHVVSSRMFLEAGLVFMQSNIAGIMQTVFDLPIRAKHLQ